MAITKIGTDMIADDAITANKIAAGALDTQLAGYLSTNSFATESYVGTALSNLVDSSPTTLDTLNELAAALGDDPNFATTTATAIGLKAPIASPTFTGNVGVGISPSNTFSVGASGTVTTRYTSTDTGAFSLLQFENNGSIVLSTDHGNAGANSAIIFKRDGAQESMRIDASGNVGIGTDSPGAGLEIKQASDDQNGGLRITRNGENTYGNLFIAAGGEGQSDPIILQHSNGTRNLMAWGRDGEVIIPNGSLGIGTTAPGFPLDVSASIGSTIGQTSTHGYSSNRNWAMRTNNYGSANWGGWSLEQSTGAGVAPTVARIGVHLNGNVGIKMGGAAGTGGTENPATALHVGGDITVGSAESVGTGAAAAIRFVNDNERARITSNYASGGGGQMGFWTDSTGGTLVQRAYIKNNGEVNLQAGLRLNGYNFLNSDVFKTYYIDGPGSSTTTRTININTYFGFTNGTGGYFMMSLHGWQTDSAAGLIHWHNAGSGGAMTSAYFEPFYTPTGLTVSVAKGTGDYDIDITLTGTHNNTHGWRMNVWG